MAARNGGETNGCTFQWKIENISQCWLKTGEIIPSPTFVEDVLEGTKWSLRLFPRGEANDSVISFYLHREKDSSGPANYVVNYRLAFLDKDGSFLNKKTILKRCFTKDQSQGFIIYVAREKVFVTERETFLPEDTLTVQCTIWNKEEEPVKPKHFYARTVFKENRRSFMWRINEFSALKRGLRNKFKDCLIDFELILNEEKGFEKKMVLCMNSFDENIKYFSIKTSIADSDGKKENCGIHEYFPSDLKKGVLLKRLLTETLMENNSRCLPIDALYLDCEYVSLTTSLLYEYFGSGITSKLTNEVLESRQEHSIGKEDSLNTAELVKDLKFMYNDAICSDTELRTSSQTFPTHKAILSARSSVFRRMFANDMKEKTSGQVDIDDLEDDTVHRMLTYIYTDSVEDLQLESASKLYAATDKYEILSLKSRCSSFLKENLCPENACDVLVLADLHNDDELKSVVQDYILGKRKEIFCSQEWKDFMSTHLKLAADIMYKKIYQE
ncbi:TD and POZ domain-containing protein 5 [Araneus ventricosus]|uniref:TD and POZ domain-containing protein 5 n=1 Tax=Araneus ventricosus TaxID=182803 RepID=A0A4Y2MC46_ARAVE|nr:TD and POZ domain-containing protein 5 [Araneus ventricosus]